MYEPSGMVVHSHDWSRYTVHFDNVRSTELPYPRTPSARDPRFALVPGSASTPGVFTEGWGPILGPTDHFHRISPLSEMQ